MKSYVLTPEIKGNAVYVRLPYGSGELVSCFLTTNTSVNQRPPHSARLQMGRDYQIQNGHLISRKIELFDKSLVLIQVDKQSGKKCKACRRENTSGSFCSSCGSFLF